MASSTKKTRDAAREQESRYAYLERILHTAEILRCWRFGGTVAEINTRMVELIGRKYSPRTTTRDLAFLERFAVVRRDSQGRWKWVPKQSILEIPVEVLKQQRTRVG